MRNTRRTVGSLLIGLAALAPSSGWAISKTAEKGAFAAGLLTLGGVVYAGIARADRHHADTIRKLHREWGKPTSTVTFLRGFDRIRLEEYRQGKRRALAQFRNGKLEHVEILRHKSAMEGFLFGGRAFPREFDGNCPSRREP